ncbi:hypothetical protein TrST_g11562 [Triparma strigata]|uniref:Uncharacterized protein n=1 Tax=Triparma strigata TaxID=1606541 RepID=A0A9W7B193_9STRA|nr:hypothetical protein TrST_g11562 [Triparma strigata]
MFSSPTMTSFICCCMLYVLHTCSAVPCMIHTSSLAGGGSSGSSVRYSSSVSTLSAVIDVHYNDENEIIVFMLPSEEGMGVMSGLKRVKSIFEDGVQPLVESYLKEADTNAIDKAVHVDGIEAFEAMEVEKGRIYVVNVSPSTPLSSLDSTISSAMVPPTSSPRVVLVTSRPLTSSYTAPLRRLSASDSTYYVYMTPNIMAGILFGILFTFCSILGFSCMNELEGQTVFVSKMPTVGREA